VQVQRLVAALVLKLGGGVSASSKGFDGRARAGDAGGGRRGLGRW
jgi:hypothetical protein